MFVHDAVDYMVTEADLRQAIETAFVHCRPGGVAVFVPDDTKESFVEGTDHGGHDGDDGRAVRFLEWARDPDPDDTWTLTDYAFLLLDPDGTVQVAHETHRLGLFGRDDGCGPRRCRLLSETVTEVTTEDRTPRVLFLGHRPPDAARLRA